MRVICLVPAGPRDRIAPTFPDHWDTRVIHQYTDLTDELIDGARALMTVPPFQYPREVLRRLRNLKLIQMVGVGVDNFDLEAARELGVPVCNVPGANVTSVAEYVIMAAIYLIRRMPEAIQAGRQGKNPYPMLFQKGCFEVQAKQLGIVGYGAIGHAVATRAVALGMEILSASVRGNPPGAAEKALGVRRVPFEELLATADIVTLHVPLAKETRRLITRKELMSMKPGACLVNAARGGIVDETDLAEVLHEGHLAGAAVDNFAVEPIASDNPLLAAPNVLLTPHSAGSTNECVRHAVERSFENIDRVLRGEAPRNCVW